MSLQHLSFSLLSRISLQISGKLQHVRIQNVPTGITITSRNFFTTTAKLLNRQIADFEEVKLAKNNTKIYLIDVREPSELQETGCIPGSINIPLGEVESVLKNMSAEDFQKCYNRQKPTKESALIFSCKIGKRSGVAQETAVKLGFCNAKNYLGSWQEWEEKNKQPFN